MYRIREAIERDLSLIHQMQNIPLREKLLTSPLPAVETFVAHRAEQLRTGMERYYLLQGEEHMPVGFVWICVAQETCEIWGRYLHSLFYACARIAFEVLGMNRLVWNVRQNNRRMLTVCERFKIRMIGSDNICMIEEKFEFVAIGKINYFEFKSEEYPERIPLMRKMCIQKGNIFSNTDR
jgi:hypothetical protein